MMRRALVLALAATLALPGCKVFKGKGKTPTVGDRLPVLVFETGIEADPVLAGVPVNLPLPLRNPNWSQPGGSADRGSGHLEAPAAPERAWSASIGAGSTSRARLAAPPVVADGRVFAVDSEANVVAFDAASGRQLWRAPVARMRQGGTVAFGGGVSVGEGRAVATSGYGVVTAFDAATGAQLWRAELGVPLRGAPAIALGRVYVLSQDNQLFALNGATGERVWDIAGTVEVAGLLGVATPAVAQGTVVAGFSSGELNAVLATNGRTVWQDSLARTGRSTAIQSLADIDASPVVDRDRVFAIGHGGRMVALDLPTGQRVWERNFAGVSTPWVAGDWVFALTVEGQLVALSRAEGRVRWVTQLPQFRKMKSRRGDIRWFGPVLASDRLWVTASNGRLAWVDPQTGALGGEIVLGEDIYLPPVIADGTIFVLTDKGRLTALR